LTAPASGLPVADSQVAANRAALGVLMMCTVISAISRGVGESFAIFLLPIAREFQTDRAALTGIYSAYMVALGVMSPIAGTIFDRLGARLCYSVGLAVFGGACLLASQVSALWQLYLLTGLGGAIGASMIGMLPASSLVSRWFQKKLSTAMGVISASMGVGLLVFSPIVQSLVAQRGWRGAYQVLGLMLLAVLALIQFLPWRRIAAGAPEIAAARKQQAADGQAWTVSRALRTPVFWALFGVMFCTSVSTFAVSVQLVAYLIESGLPPLQAASIYGLVGMVSIVGTFLAGSLADRIGEMRVAIISYGSTIAGVAALAALGSSHAMAMVAAFVVLFGTMQGSRGPLVAVLSARNFAGGRQTGIYGAVLFGMGMGGALGSWGSGALYDLTGGYYGGFALSAAGAACGLLLFVTVPGLRGQRPPTLHDARALSVSASKPARRL
jgi:MFS family permease